MTPYSLPPESPANAIRNALQVVQGIKPYEWSPKDVEMALSGIEGRLMQALNLLEPPPSRGVLDPPEPRFITANAGRVQHFGEGINLDPEATIPTEPTR